MTTATSGDQFRRTPTRKSRNPGHRTGSLLTSIGLMMLLLGTGCRSDNADSGRVTKRTGNPVIAVTNYPLRFFAEQIGGDQVDVVYPMQNAADPARWHPVSEAISQLQRADRVFINGADYEKWMNAVTLNEDRLVNTTADARNQLLELSDTTIHQHGPEGERSNPEWASTTWLDMDLAITQARVIRDELLELLPDQRSRLESNFEGLEKKLREIKKRQTEVARQLEGESMLAAQPVYQYLGRSLVGKKTAIRVLEFENGIASDEQWKTNDAIITELDPRLILWNGEPPAETRRLLTDRNIRIVEFPTLDQAPPTGDFVTAMLASLQRLQDAIPPLR